MRSLGVRRTINFLLITADDLEWSTVGVYGSQIENITPHIDKLASEGIRLRSNSGPDNE